MDEIHAPVAYGIRTNNVQLSFLTTIGASQRPFQDGTLETESLSVAQLNPASLSLLPFAASRRCFLSLLPDAASRRCFQTLLPFARHQ
ncbi:hypothetical protein N9B46_00300 [Mariniblastus sp.]|nr:hypothetical protein [Mariniblastus sp.]